MKKLKNEKGAITIVVLMSVLAMTIFLISTYVIVANKVKTQKEIVSQTREIYENTGTMEEIYNSYFINEEVIPIYTSVQFNKIGTGEYVNIEQKGKIYKFDPNAHYVLMNDINFTNSEFNIVCGAYTSASQTNKFTGILDGLGNTIKGINAEKQAIIGYNTGMVQNINLQGITINSSDDYSAGFISYNAGTVQNINLEGVNVEFIARQKKDETSMNYCGGLIAYNTGTVQNINVEGINVEGINSESKSIYYLGGIIGYSSGKVNNCNSNNGLINSVINVSTKKPRYTGGIIGFNNGIVQNCNNASKVIGYEDVGGVIGYNYKGTTQNASNTGEVEGNNKIGGVIGYNGASGTIKNSYNIGTIKTTNLRMGGVVGINQGVMSECYNEGNITGKGSVIGGVVGDNYVSSSAIPKVKRCYNIGRITVEPGSHTIGGVVGRNSGESASVQEVFNLAEIILKDVNNIGGVIGTNTGKAKYLYNNGKVSIEGIEEIIGGIVGNGSVGTLMNAYNIGEIKGYQRVGGIAGNSRGVISNCYNYGNVKASDIDNSQYIGGIVGTNYREESGELGTAVVEECCNSGNVEIFGGIVGRNLGSIKKCYNNGIVGIEGLNRIAGGIAGYNGRAESINQETGEIKEKAIEGDIENCYNYANVYARGEKGLIVAYNYSGTISGCLYSRDVEEDKGGVNGQDTEGARRATEEEMANKEIFPPFPDVMEIINETNTDDQGNTYLVFEMRDGYKYPVFVWQD